MLREVFVCSTWGRMLKLFLYVFCIVKVVKKPIQPHALFTVNEKPFHNKNHLIDLWWLAGLCSRICIYVIVTRVHSITASTSGLLQLPHTTSTLPPPTFHFKTWLIQGKDPKKWPSFVNNTDIHQPHKGGWLKQLEVDAFRCYIGIIGLDLCDHGDCWSVKSQLGPLERWGSWPAGMFPQLWL